MITTSKSLIGFNGYMLENEDDQNTPITVFTEDQGVKTTPDEIYEAEEEDMTNWENALENQITTLSVELSEIDSYTESFKSMLSENAKNDYNYAEGL